MKSKNIIGNRYKMKFYKTVLFLLLFKSIFICNSLDNVIIENGTIELKNTALYNDKIIRLNGNWLYKWMENENSIKNEDFDKTNWKMYKVPGYWNNLNKESYGYAWFKITLKNIPENSGLYLPYIMTSYNVYENGMLIGTCGKPAESRYLSRPNFKKNIISLQESKSSTLYIFVSNFFDINGGFYSAPEIGNINILYEKYYSEKFDDLVIIGIITMMMLFHFGFWIIRKKEKAALYFALFCMIAILRLITVNGYLTSISSGLYFIQNKIDYLTIPLSSLINIIFFRAILPKMSSKIINKTFIILSILFSLFIVLTPPWIYTKLLYIFQVSVLIIYMYTTYCSVKGIIKKIPGSIMIFTGYLLFLLSLFVDILIANLNIPISFVFQYGFLSLFLVVTLLFILRFSKALSTAEYLSKNLQREVNHKTQKIKKMADKNLNFFIYFSHEIKTPLTLLNNYFKRYIKTVTFDENLKTIDKSMNILSRMIVNLSDFIKIEKKIDSYNFEFISLSDYIYKKIEMFKSIADKKNIILRYDIAKDIYIKSDITAIDRILNNLIENALKYSFTEGIIKIKLYQKDKVAFLKINNGGYTIPVNEQKKVFYPYYRSTFQKKNSNGIGIGLSIVKKLCVSMGLKIKLSSSDNRGTTVSILFPSLISKKESIKNFVSQSPSEPVDIIQENKKSYINEHNSELSNILLIEDNIEILEFLVSELNFNYNIFTAENGTAALSRLKNIPVPDLIISDIMMPFMSSIDFIKILKEKENYNPIPIIFLTAKDNENSIIEGLESGAVDYISKPFDIETLKLKISSIINNNIYAKKQYNNKFKKKLTDFIDTEINETEYSNNNVELFCSTHNLSGKEKLILLKIKDGLSNKEIAYELGVSINTVKKQISGIFKKTSSQNRVELINKLY